MTFHLTVTLQETPDGLWYGFIGIGEDWMMITERSQTPEACASRAIVWVIRELGPGHEVKFERRYAAWSDA
jgi:hypothetical protein